MQQLILFKTHPVRVAQTLVVICFFEIIFRLVRAYYFNMSPQDSIERILRFHLFDLYHLENGLSSILFTLSLLYTILISLVIFIIKYGQFHKIDKEILIMKIVRINFVFLEWIFFGPLFTFFLQEILTAPDTSQPKGWTQFKHFIAMPGMIILLCSQALITFEYKNYWQTESDIFATRRIFYFCFFQLYRVLLLTIGLIIFHGNMLYTSTLFIVMQTIFLFTQFSMIFSIQSHIIFYDLEFTNLWNHLSIFHFVLILSQHILMLQGAFDIRIIDSHHELLIYFLLLSLTMPAYYSVRRSQSLKILIKMDLRSIQELTVQLYLISLYRDDEKQLDFFLVIRSKCKQLRSRHIFDFVYQKFIAEHPTNMQAKMDYARFLFYKNRGKARAIKICQEIQLKFEQQKNSSNWLLQLKLRQILSQFQRTISQINQEAYEGYMDFEIVLQSEEMVQLLIKQISKIIQLNLRFWRKLGHKSTVDFQLMELDQEINNLKKNTQVYWRQLKGLSQKYQDTLERKQEWFLLYCWYKLFITNKKLKKQEQVKLYSKESLNHEEFNQETLGIYDPQMAFSKNSAIFYTDIKGKILKVSSACSDLFGTGPFENLNEIIPRVNKVFHEYVMKKFYYDGRQRQSLYRKKRIFCQSYFGHLIEARKYMKLFLNEQNDINYICMIRPIRKSAQSHYILLDSDWNIQGVSEQLYEHLPVTQISLLLLCPSLIKFTQFFKHMRKEDESNFWHPAPNKLKNIFFTMLQNDDAFNHLTSDKAQRFERRKTYNFTILIPNSLEVIHEEYLKILEEASYVKIEDQESIQRQVSSPFFIPTKFKDSGFKRRVQLLVQKRNAFIIQSLSRLFRDHCSDISQINRVLQVSLHHHKKKQDKNHYYHLLKITRFEWLEMTHHFAYLTSKTTLNFSAQVYHPQDFSLGLQINTLRSQRSFLAEGDFQDAFPQNQATSQQISNEQNIFLKEESNKFRLTGSYIILQVMYVRLLLIVVVLIISITGVNDIIYPKQKIQLGITQTEQVRLVDLATMQIHEHLVDIILFNQNYTQHIYLNSPLSNFSNIDEFFTYKYQKLSILFEYIYIIVYAYAYEGFVPVLYGLGQNTEVSIIDVFDQFQANMVFLMQSNLKLLNFNSECYKEIQMITIPDFQIGFYNTYLEALNQERKTLQLTFQLIMSIILFMVSISTIFCFHSIVAAFKAIKIRKKLFLMLNQIDTIELQQCICYWKLLNQFLVGLQDFDDKKNLTHILTAEKKKVNIRQVLQSRIWAKQKLISAFLIFLYYIFLLSPLLFYYGDLMNQLQSCVTDFELNLFLLQPNDNWAILALKELYINEHINQNEINIEAYQRILRNFTRQNLFQNNLRESEKLVLGNLCNKGDNICIESGLLSQGLLGFHNRIQELIDSYFGVERLDDFSLYNIYKLSLFHDEYIQNLHKIHKLWSDQMSFKLNDAEQRVLAIILLLIVIITHLILFEGYFNSWAHEKQFELKNFYKSFYPNITLNQQKRLRVEFQKVQLL